MILTHLPWTYLYKGDAIVITFARYPNVIVYLEIDCNLWLNTFYFTTRYTLTCVYTHLLLLKYNVKK